VSEQPQSSFWKKLQQAAEKLEQAKKTMLSTGINWRKVLPIFIAVIALIGSGYAAAQIISNWVTVGQVSVKPGYQVSAAVIQNLPSEMALYEEKQFKVQLTNNDQVQHNVNLDVNLTLIAGSGIDSSDFTITCNETDPTVVSDGDETVILRFPTNTAMAPGDQATYVCRIKFIGEDLVDKVVRVEATASEAS